MINLKNSLKKALAGAFGVITMLSPLQSAQCLGIVDILSDIARKNNFDLDTMPDLESNVVIHEAYEIEHNIVDGMEAFKKLILEPNDEDNKNVLNGIRNRLNNDELYYTILGEAIRVIVDDATTYLNCVIGTGETTDLTDDDIKRIEYNLNRLDDNIKRLIDFIENTINKKCSFGTRYQIFFNKKYELYLPRISYTTNSWSVLKFLSVACHRCRNDARFGPLVKNLCELLTNIYEECGATEEVDIAESM